MLILEAHECSSLIRSNAGSCFTTILVVEFPQGAPTGTMAVCLKGLNPFSSFDNKKTTLKHWSSNTRKNICIRYFNILLMEEVLQHLGCIKPRKQWDIYHINWCRISSINSMPTQFIHAVVYMWFSLSEKTFTDLSLAVGPFVDIGSSIWHRNIACITWLTAVLNAKFPHRPWLLS